MGCKRESIEAHLMIVFAALAAGRWTEAQAGWPIRKSGKTARRYRNLQIQAGLRTITAADPSPTTSAKHAPPSAPRPAVCTNLSQVRSQKPMHEIRVHGHSSARASGRASTHSIPITGDV
jgi:hypothetical protein